MTDWIVSNWQGVLLIVSAGLGGLVAVLKVVAPMTHTEWDNRVLAALSKVVGVLAGFVTPKVKPPAEPPPP